MGDCISHRIAIITAIIITLLSILSVVFGFNPNVQNFTRTVTLKQGRLRGIVVKTRLRGGYVPVEQYLGIPYAAPPVGHLRFMPPRESPHWKDNRFADSFGPVCPQRLPDSTKMEPHRKEYFRRLEQQYLMNESEDCLYLNIYAPYQGDDINHRYAVMVFIHGESYEWNTGNAYDGSVLAAFGKVLVVTLNFRLGVLGFLKTGFSMDAKANFGLIDQVAALIWIRDNIREFGGDPDQVTMFGHGTGAACISLLTLSSMVLADNKLLFKRAILMGGTALSDWALSGNTRDVTHGIVESLNCSSEDEALKTCLRKKRLREIKEAAEAPTAQYITRFGPVVDSFVIPNEPEKSMTNYTDLFQRYELMYGLTEVESVNLLDPVHLLIGMLDREFEEELMDYMNGRCQFKPVKCKIDALYKYWENTNAYGRPTRSNVTKARDVLLDILSDARSAAPMVRMAKHHSGLNPQSYFYVFGHVTASRNSIRNKSVHGDELPYIFGVPLDGSSTYFRDHYSEDEKDLSEMMMTLWCNFAYNGNPNVPSIHMYGKVAPVWPEFDNRDETYLYLDVPHFIGRHYRNSEMKYWNNIFPSIESERIIPTDNIPPFIQIPTRPPYIPPHISPFATTTEKLPSKVTHPVIPPFFEVTPNLNDGQNIVETATSAQKPDNTMTILITIGALFLLINVILFSYLYHKCVLKKKRNANLRRNIEEHMDVLEISGEKVAKLEQVANGCSLMKMIATKSSRSDDTYEAVKTHESTSSRRKLTRQISTSTIDAHTKVRDWIAQEIVSKYSPKLFRKNRRQNSSESKGKKKKKEKKSEDIPSKVQVEDNFKITGSNSTLGQSPTRPVSPVEGVKESPKASMIPVHKSKKAEKISVAIDATPAGRGNSVLCQQPIELTKSLDYSSFDSGTDVTDGQLKRANTLDDIFSMNSGAAQSQKSLTSINVTLAPVDEPTVIRIDHGSKSDGINSNTTGRRLKTFNPDINVTSRDEPDLIMPLSPEESLQIIKRRNFPKVLPDLPGESKQSISHKRRSMPAPNHLFLPIPENPSLSQPNSPTGKALARCPPAPPPRISSSLARNGHTPLMQSAPAIAQEPPLPEEPEVACNNLYIGPLIPSRDNRKITMTATDSYRINNQPIYDNLNPKKTDSENNNRRGEPKVIIKPTISRQISDPSKIKGPRVVVNDILMAPTKYELDESKGLNNDGLQSGIPVFTRQTSKKGDLLTAASNNKESSSESTTPSEGSDTGTVVKRVEL